MEKLKVIIADDMEILAEKNKKIVEKFEELEIIGIANNGQEEYDMIIEKEPDLVITDNQMPEKNGINVIELISNSSISKKPEFILVTSDTDAEFIKKAYELGVFKVVNKMSVENELKYTIDDFLYLQNTDESDIIEELQVEQPKNVFIRLYNKLRGKSMDFDFDKWRKKYETKEIVNIKKEFTDEELELLRKLGVELLDKIYTEREFELLDMDVIKYYYEDDMKEDEKQFCVPLPENVSREEYNKLVDKIRDINIKYGF